MSYIHKLTRKPTIPAINKPQGKSSADTLRDIQTHFTHSQTFHPWLESERKKQATNPNLSRKKKKRALDVKLGHGGTLDPLATGILVAGVGRGTKELNNFLGCTKTYEAVVLFGAETDTYDQVGKVVRRGPYGHVTRAGVEGVLGRFRGEVMQRPPVFSALRVNGKRLYEYAREGKVPPVEIQERPVVVEDLRVVDWYEPGSHGFRWPEEEMRGEEKAAAEQILDKGDSSSEQAKDTKSEAGSSTTKPELTPQSTSEDAPDETGRSAKRQKISAKGDQAQVEQGDPAPAATATPSESTETKTEHPSSDTLPSPSPPAVKITMTVSSGFYVRSLAHDLGKALGSCALMCSLVRTRQADFELESDKVLEYKDLEAGEEVWGPKVRRFLDDWVERKSVKENEGKQE